MGGRVCRLITSGESRRGTRGKGEERVRREEVANEDVLYDEDIAIADLTKWWVHKVRCCCCDVDDGEEKERRVEKTDIYVSQQQTSSLSLADGDASDT